MMGLVRPNLVSFSIKEVWIILQTIQPCALSNVAGWHPPQVVRFYGLISDIGA